jgi:chemotaxis protein CheD
MELRDLKSRWDHILQSRIITILPGQFHVTRQDEILVTTLGSCVSACIRDKSIGLGGMNHFMLPEELRDFSGEPDDSPWNTAARYGINAMELLINAILKYGGARKNLEIKIFGGANVISKMRNIGDLNANFIRKYLNKENLQIEAEDLGGCSPRKVLYCPATGKARVKRFPCIMKAAILRKENSYIRKFSSDQTSGTIEFFE